MKAELIYLWINQDGHGCFHQEGFNFSPRYRVSYNQDTKRMIIEQLDQFNVFRNDHIANVSALIGENGTGKTTLLEYLTTFDDVPLADEQRPEYQPFRRNQNKFRSFIAVYLDHENDSRRIINITNDTIFCNGESFEPFSNAEYRAGNNLLEKISRIYLSNSSYSQTQGAQTRGTISNISITDNALPAIFRAFYMKKYGRESDQPANQNTPFNTLITILAEKEDSKTMHLYSKHSDYIRDILRTAYIYNDDYFEGLAVQYSDLFHSKQEAQDFVFFNYLDEADWGKRILAKLTHDIVEEAIG